MSISSWSLNLPNPWSQLCGIGNSVTCVAYLCRLVGSQRVYSAFLVGTLQEQFPEVSRPQTTNTSCASLGTSPLSDQDKQTIRDNIVEAVVRCVSATG